ncbi:thiol reductant ABC exporter subunit CydD [Gemmobacter nanjingensis]|nr:ATP-binding cassette domain-containing protein [Gemmobacter nanjingensis]GHC28554.1 thiol reductant ABC exporter subunit CydD [Gemmobacter nanjingensis]
MQPDSRSGMLAQAMAPERRRLRLAAAISAGAALVWPVQAALLAWSIGRLVADLPVPPLPVALGFVCLGLLRMALGLWAERLAQGAAETIISGLRDRILCAEAARATETAFGGPGSVAALAGEKLAMLAPWLMRYGPARARVAIVPPILLVLSFGQSWAAGLILLITGPLIPLFMALVGMAAKEASARQLAGIGTLNDLLVERLSALADIRLLGAGPQVAEGFASEAATLRQRSMAVLRLAFLSSTVLELFAAIGVAMMAVYVGFSLLGLLDFGTWGTPLTPAQGMFLLLLAPEFYQPLRDLAAAWHDRAAADALRDELDQWQAAPGPDRPGAGGRAEPLPGPADLSLTGCHLPSGACLPDIRIAAGEAVALVGPSGAGKTSALRLMAGLATAAPGEVRVAGGQKLDAATADGWRARIGWMPQRVHFPGATLDASLRLGREGDLGAAMEAAAAGHLTPRLRTRPGETGSGLSGGEARRLSLARALLTTPDVILADEPTADLDAETARAVTEGLLSQRARGATLVIATHDPALAARMDRIIHIGGAT